MMNWGYGMMNFGAFWFIGSLMWIIVFIDLILLGVWLWKQIQKK